MKRTIVLAIISLSVVAVFLAPSLVWAGWNLFNPVYNAVSLYRIDFKKTGVADPVVVFNALELDSAFEFPVLADTGFQGWMVSGSATVYTGYHTLNEFSTYISDHVLTFTASIV